SNKLIFRYAFTKLSWTMSSANSLSRVILEHTRSKAVWCLLTNSANACPSPALTSSTSSRSAFIHLPLEQCPRPTHAHGYLCLRPSSSWGRLIYNEIFGILDQGLKHKDEKSAVIAQC